LHGFILILVFDFLGNTGYDGAGGDTADLQKGHDVFSVLESDEHAARHI
jgi:hypothetical protein